MSIVSELGGIPGKQTISELVAGIGKQKNYILGPGPVEGQEETIDDTKVYYEPLNSAFNKDPGFVEDLLEKVPYILEFDGKAFEINSRDDLMAFAVNDDTIPEYDFSMHPFAFYPMHKVGSDEMELWILVADNNPHSFGIYKMESGSESESKENVVVVEVGIASGNPTPSLINYSFEEVYSMLKAKDGPIVAFRELDGNGDSVSVGTTTLIAEAVAIGPIQFIYIEFFKPGYADNLGVEKITFSSNGGADKIESFYIAYESKGSDMPV